MANREQIEVLVVDENPLTRFGMLSIANLHPLLHVCEEAADARSAREAHARECPQIVILEIVLPHGDGIELLKEFARAKPKCRTVVVSELIDASTVRRAFHAGAQAYVSKKDEPPELLSALDATIAGGAYMSARVSEALHADSTRETPGRVAKLISTLSDREFHIFRRMAAGEGSTHIARELAVSVKTIETHQSRLKEKLHLTSCADLRRVAVTWSTSRKS